MLALESVKTQIQDAAVVIVCTYVGEGGLNALARDNIVTLRHLFS